MRRGSSGISEKKAIDYLYTKGYGLTRLVLEGDSITYYPQYYGPRLIARLPSQSIFSQYWNVSTGGERTDQFVTEALTEVDPHYDASLPRNIVIMYGGVNDLALPRTDVQIESSIRSWSRGRKTVGWTVILCTLMGNGLNAQAQTYRTAINTWLRNNYNGVCQADYLIDFAANAHLGSWEVGAYFEDWAHPTAVGSELMCDVAMPVLKSAVVSGSIITPDVPLLGNVVGVGEKTWNGTNLSLGCIYLNKFHTDGGTIRSVLVKAKTAVSNVKVAIYSDNSGTPDALVASSGSQVAPVGWNSLPLEASAVLSAGDYWLAENWQTGSRGEFAASATVMKYYVNAYANDWPATMPATSNTTGDLAIAGWGTL